jgi:hypothetical protein
VKKEIIEFETQEMKIARVDRNLKNCFATVAERHKNLLAFGGLSDRSRLESEAMLALATGDNEEALRRINRLARMDKIGMKAVDSDND